MTRKIMNTQTGNKNDKVNTNYLWDDSFESEFLLQQTNAAAWNNYPSSNLTNINQPYPKPFNTNTATTTTDCNIINSPQQQISPFNLNSDDNNNVNNNNNLFNNNDQDTYLASLSQSILSLKNEPMINNPLDIVGPACLFNGDVIDVINNTNNNNQNLAFSNNFYNNPNDSKFTKSAPSTPPKGPYLATNNNNNNNNIIKEENEKVEEGLLSSSSIIHQQQHKSVPNSPTHLRVSWTEDQLSIPSTSPLSSPGLTSTYQADNINNIDVDTQQQQQQQQKSISPMFNSSSSYERSNYPYPHYHYHHQQQQYNHHPRKSVHNAVEKKYRNNINDKIAELRDAVPALRYARSKKEHHQSQQRLQSITDDEEDVSHPSSHEDEPIFIDGVAVATKLNKASILQKATEYIYHLQHTNQDLHQDIETLLTIIMSSLPDNHGKNIVYQFRQHCQQRDQFQKNQLVIKEKEKRYKKSLSSPSSVSSANLRNENYTSPYSSWPQQQQSLLFSKTQYQQQQQQDPSFLSPYSNDNNPSISSSSSLSSSPLVPNNTVEDNSQGRQQKYSIDIPY